MKFLNIALFFAIAIILCCTISATFGQDENPQSPAVKRLSLRRPVGKSAKTTTTTAAPPQLSDDDYGEENAENQYGDEEDELAEKAASSTTTTTTEAPKKTVGPVIRPFRSNDDFLNSLKRRQMESKKHRAEKASIAKSKPTPVAVQNDDEEDEDAPAPVAAPSKSYKSNSSLSRRKFNKPGKSEPVHDEPAAEESAQQQEEKPKRLPGRLPIRKRI